MTFGRKLFNECFNTVMSATLAFGGILLIRLLIMSDTQEWTGVIHMLPLLLCYPVGRCLHRVKRKIAIPIGIASSTILALFPLIRDHSNTLAWVLRVAILPTFGFLLFCIPYVNGTRLLNRFHFIGGMMIFASCSLISAISQSEWNPFPQERYILPMTVAASIFIVTGVYIFNYDNIRTETSPDKKRTKFPIGIRANSWLMISMITGLSLLFANLDKVRQFVANCFVFVVGIILRICSIGGLSLFDGYKNNGSPMTALPPAETSPESIIEQILLVIAVIIVIMIIGVAAVRLIRFGIKGLGVSIREFFANLFRRIQPEDEEYIEESEDLLEKTNINLEIVQKLKELTKRKERLLRFEDMRTNREKVRFVFQSMLRRINRRNKAAIASTPNELISDVEKIAPKMGNEFIQVYNMARYSEENVPDSAAELARKINKMYK